MKAKKMKATEMKPLMVRLPPEVHRGFKTLCAQAGVSAQAVLMVTIRRLVLDPKFLDVILKGHPEVAP